MSITSIKFTQMLVRLAEKVNVIASMITLGSTLHRKARIKIDEFNGVVSQFDGEIREYNDYTSKDAINNILIPATNCAKALGHIALNMADQDKEMYKAGINLLNECNSIRNTLEGNGLLKKDSNKGSTKSHGENDYIKDAYGNLKRNLDECRVQTAELKRLVIAVDRKASSVSADIEKIDVEFKAEIDKAKSIYNEGVKEIEQKKQQIDDILGHASRKVIAGDFGDSAAQEKEAADSMRNASMLCMLLIILILGYSAFETATDDFQWEASLFRVSLAFLLSVPAAYLARESAKHRQQQYQYLQTSLDLKAISPYIASLPEDAQHKLKIEVASRIFAARDFSNIGADPYPLNTHEIIMELIKKLEFTQSDSKKSDSK